MQLRLRFLFLAASLLPALLFAEQASRGRVKTQDGQISYEVLGQDTAKIPVIAVNGGPGFAHTYLLASGVWQQIGRNRRVILYDQRGTGKSTMSRRGAGFTTADQVNDLEQLRSSLHLSRFVLAGDSYGGFLGIACALAHPEHVAALILSDAPGPNLQKKLTLLPQVFPDALPVSKSPNKKLTYQELQERDIRQHLHMFFYSPQKARAYIALSSQFGYVAAVDDAVSKAAQGVDFTSRLREIEAPTLVLNGRFDMNVPPLTAWRMTHDIPNAQYVFFEQSGHFPAYEEPRKYQKTVEAFLARLASP